MDGINKISLNASSYGIQKMYGANSSSRRQAESVSPAQQKQLDKLKETAQEFESLFLSSILNKMSDVIFKSDLTEESNATTIFREMRNQELARSMSKAGGIGLSKILYDQLSKNI